MYILELISKIKDNFQTKTLVQDDNSDEVCSHIFAPLDSTKKYFACTKCGYVVEKSELKNKNFFVQND